MEKDGHSVKPAAFFKHWLTKLIVLIPTRNVLRRVLMLSLAGTRGGTARMQILAMLGRKPMNINEISRELALDYKSAQHHVRVLEKSGLITSARKKYGNTYTLSALLKAHRDVLDEISRGAGDMGKTR